MAKASAQITLHYVIDIKATYRYYLLQSSTAAKPAKPTVYPPPSSWGDAEPAYTSGSTNSLYFVDCTVFSDDTYKYSDVSLSTSYEAAKDAYNKAVNAQNTIDNLEIGGRNLLPKAKMQKTITIPTNSLSGYGYTSGLVNLEVAGQTAALGLKTSTDYVISFVAWCDANTQLMHVDLYPDTLPEKQITITTTPTKYVFPVYSTHNAMPKGALRFFRAGGFAEKTYITDIMIEQGTKPSQSWTPAPEDVDAAINSKIASVDVEYYLSTSSTALTGGSWQTTAPAWVNGRYMWSRTKKVNGAGVITYSPSQNGTCIAGATGAAGKGVTSIVEQYYQSTSATAQSGGSWSTTAPTWVDGKYIWTRSVITYTDNSTTTTTAVCVTGQKGATGATGKGIKSTAVTYQASSSGTTAPSGTWTTAIPSVTKGQYLWSRTVITYTDNTTSTTYSVAYIPTNGQNGATGATGTGVQSIVQQYYLSTSKTSQTGGSWVASMPTWSSGKYLWTRYQINYTNPTSTAYTSPICDSSWEAVNEIQVGGRNLLLNTKDFAVTEGYGAIISDNYKGFKVRHLSLTDAETSFSRPFAQFNDILVEKLGAVYTLSFYAKGTGVIHCHFYSETTGYVVNVLNETSQGESTRIVNGRISITLSSEWTRYWVRWTSSSTEGDINIAKHVLFKLWGGNEAYICGAKLELGNKATDWSPAPEDVDSSVNELKTKYDSVTVQYNQLSDKFNWIVKSGTSVTDFTITDRLASLTAQHINLNGLVTFSGLSSDTQMKINQSYNWMTGDGTNLLNMVKKWTNNAVSTSTYINGGWIATNTITAAQIAIGDFTNYVTVNESNSASAITNNHPFATGANTLFIDGYIAKKTATSRFIALSNYMTNSFEDGDELYYSFTVKGAASGKCQVKIWFYGDGSIDDKTNKESFSGATHAFTTSEQTFTGSFKLGAVSGYGYYAVGFVDTTSTKSQVYVKNVSVRKRNGSTLIANGAITADKLSVTSLSAISANMGTITAGSMNIGNGKFKVNADGSFTATSATIIGSVDATTMSAKELIKMYTGSISRGVISGCLLDNSFATFIGNNLTANNVNPALPYMCFYTSKEWGTTISLKAKTIFLEANEHEYAFSNGGLLFYGPLTNYGVITSYSGGIELYHNTTPYIDFHYAQNSSNYTSRLWGNGAHGISFGGGQYGAIDQNGDTGYFYPGTSGNYALGHPDHRWATVYCTNINNSSLVTLKTEIQPAYHILDEINKTDVFHYKLKQEIERHGEDHVRTGFVIGDGYRLSEYLLGRERDGIDIYSAIGMTFGGIKELYMIIKKLQQEVNELRNQKGDLI